MKETSLVEKKCWHQLKSDLTKARAIKITIRVETFCRVCLNKKTSFIILLNDKASKIVTTAASNPKTITRIKFILTGLISLKSSLLKFI